MILQDSGTLQNTTAINLFYGGLTVSNQGLSNLPNRLPTGIPMTFRGGTFTFSGAPTRPIRSP